MLFANNIRSNRPLAFITAGAKTCHHRHDPELVPSPPAPHKPYSKYKKVKLIL